MLKDLFNNRLFIGALAFFILCVVGGTFYMWHVERQEAAKLAETQAHIKALTEKQQPTTAEAPVGDISQDGHVQADGTFHAEPHEPIASVDKTSRDEGLMSKVLTPLQKRAFYASFGLKPPPPGHRYARLGDGSIKLVKDKEPIINVAWGEGYGNYHQLTDIEFARYSCLLAIDDSGVIKYYGLSEEEVNLGLAWKQELYEKTKGPRPAVTAHWSHPSSDPLTDAESEAIFKQMRDRENELVPPAPESFPVDYDVFDTIIANIRETLSRR